MFWSFIQLSVTLSTLFGTPPPFASCFPATATVLCKLYIKCWTKASILWCIVSDGPRCLPELKFLNIYTNIGHARTIFCMPFINFRWKRSCCWLTLNTTYILFHIKCYRNGTRISLCDITFCITYKTHTIEQTAPISRYGWMDTSAKTIMVCSMSADNGFVELYCLNSLRPSDALIRQ